MHTPGPWETFYAEPGSTFDGRAKWLVKQRNAVGVHVEVVSPRSRQEADARLIATAPDLLEALRDLVATVPWQAAHQAAKRDGYSVELARTRLAADAAIAKATGDA